MGGATSTLGFFELKTNKDRASSAKGNEDSRLFLAVDSRTIFFFPWYKLGLNVGHKTNPYYDKYDNLSNQKTRTYHWRVGTERTAGRREGVGQDWAPTEQFAQETSVPRTVQGIVKVLRESLSRSTNKRNLI